MGSQKPLGILKVLKLGCFNYCHDSLVLHLLGCLAWFSAQGLACICGGIGLSYWMSKDDGALIIPDEGFSDHCASRLPLKKIILTYSILIISKIRLKGIMHLCLVFFKKNHDIYEIS